MGSWLNAVVLTFIVATVAVAGDLSSPFSLENAQVLPKNVRNVRFFNLFMTMENRFSRAGGGETPLGDRLNKAIKWSDVYREQSDEIQKKLIQSILKDNALAEDGLAGYATGEVNTFVDVKVPIFAMALGEKFTMAVAVPIVKVDVSVETGFVKTNDGQKFVTSACDASPDKCNEAARKLNNATAKKLERLGYEPIRSETISGIGDMQLIGKYQVMGEIDRAFAIKSTVTLPTGSKPNADKALDITTGDGRYKLGAMAIYDHRIIPQSRWNAYVGYTALMPTSLVRRLPTSNEDSLSNDKEELRKNWGHLASLGTSIDYTFRRAGITLTAAYAFQFLSGAHYTGSKVDPSTLARYGYLDDLEPSQTLHSVNTTLNFSTVDWYRQKEFFLPFEVNLVYSRPIAGRNAPKASVIAGEAVFFF